MKLRAHYVFTLFALFFVLSCYSQNPVLDSLKTAYSQAKNDTMRCNILNQIIENEGDDKIWPIYNDQLLKIAEAGIVNAKSEVVKKTLIKYQAGAYNNRGILAQQNGDNDKALENMGISLKLEESIGDKEGASVALINIGYIYNSTGDVKKAMEYWHRSLKIQEEIGDKKGMAYSMNNMGSAYHHQGDIHKALDYLHRGLKIQEEIDDKKGISNSLNNIAGIYGNQGDHKKALEYYQRSLKIRQEMKDQRAIATSYNNIGYSYTNMGEIDKAMDYYLKGLEIRESLEDKKGIANSLANLGSSYLKKGDQQKALDHFRRSYALQNEIGNKEGISTTAGRISEMMLSQGNLNEALKYAMQSYQLSKELGYPENIIDASGILKDIYKKQGNYKGALEMHELEIQMRDSINNEETKKEAVKKSFQYQYEKIAAADSVKVAEEKKITEAQFKQEKTQRFALYGGLALVALFGIFMFNRFRVTHRQKNIITQQKEEVEHQKELVQEKQKEIVDSITYAKRLQNAILPSQELLNKHLSQSFVFYQPKDIVAGDFYWMHVFENGQLHSNTNSSDTVLIAAADSTGHGVPGAMVSIVCSNALDKAVKEFGLNQPAQILDKTREIVMETFSKSGDEIKDGMDCLLCLIDLKKMQLEFSAANRPLWIIRNNQLLEYKGDKMPIGKSDFDYTPFTQQSIDLEKGDLIYLLTDGFADQFGGPKGKKFMYSQLKEALLSLSGKALEDQRELLKKILNDWTGNTEQVDDITVIGIRV